MANKLQRLLSLPSIVLGLQACTYLVPDFFLNKGTANSNLGPCTYCPSSTFLFSPPFINLITLLKLPTLKPTNPPNNKHFHTQNSSLPSVASRSPLFGGLETPDSQRKVFSSLASTPTPNLGTHKRRRNPDPQVCGGGMPHLCSALG